MVLFPTVDFDATDYVWALEDADFLANFFNNGLLCCCYSVKTGFWDKTFCWID